MLLWREPPSATIAPFGVGLPLREHFGSQDPVPRLSSISVDALDRVRTFVRLPSGEMVSARVASGCRGLSAARPALFRLLADAQPGDILLIEQVDRLSRLTEPDWEKLKAELLARQIRVVALDLPTSWAMATAKPDDFTSRMLGAIIEMLLDMLAAVARKDYEDRRRRQAEGLARAKAAGAYRGRPEDSKRNAGIASMLAAGSSWSTIQATTGASRATIAKIEKRRRE